MKMVNCFQSLLLAQYDMVVSKAYIRVPMLLSVEYREGHPDQHSGCRCCYQ